MSGPIDDPIFAALEELWTAAEGCADALAAAEAAVVRWAWFSDSWCCALEPFVAQRNGDAPGRELRSDPDLTSASAARCGFDQSNRAVVSCSYHYGGHSVTHTVRFFEDNRCRELTFHRDELAAAALYEYDQDVLVRRAAMGRPGWGQDSPPKQLAEYFYRDDACLDRVRRRSWDDGYPPETRRRSAVGMTETFEYDDEGRLSRITACGNLPDAQPYLVYKRRTTTSAAPNSRTALADRLAERVEDVVRQCGYDEEVWCLALHYERESPVPPDIVLGAERERSEWGAEVDLLNPAEWDANEPPRRLKLDDPDLVDTYAEAWDALSAEDGASEEMVKILNAAAKRLNRHRLGGHLNVTQDFFVYAVDLELEDLDANLRAALGKERYRKLRDSGLTAE